MLLIVRSVYAVSNKIYIIFFEEVPLGGWKRIQSDGLRTYTALISSNGHTFSFLKAAASE